MYSSPHLALKYLQYYLTASNGKGHGTHSPFVFDFIRHVLNDRAYYPEYKTAEKLREQALKDTTLLAVEDYGAGTSAGKKNDRRTITSIARQAVKPRKYARLLFRIVRKYQPQHIVELGTSLGITTAYLSLANPTASIITLEGAKEVAAVARKHFESLQLSNIRIVEGNFDHTLSSVINGLSSIDFAFIDGNHRREPTLRYFEQMLAKTGNDSIIVIDDIHWSDEMEGAWRDIRQHPAARCTIDLFFMGIVFFRSEFRERQQFTVRF